MTDDIRQRHVDKNSLCGWCCCEWPCDAIRKQNEIDKMVLDFEDLHVRYVAANADADRLAEALRQHIGHLDANNTDHALPGHSVGCRVIQRQSRSNDYTLGYQCVADCAERHRGLTAALRQHEEATR